MSANGAFALYNPNWLAYTGLTGTVIISGWSEWISLTSPLGCGEPISCELQNSAYGGLSSTQQTYVEMEGISPWAVTQKQNIPAGYDLSLYAVCHSSVG